MGIREVPQRVQMRSAHKQRGAVSIEFAAMFVIFFLLFYAVVGYTVPLLLAATYQEVASAALREGIRHHDLLLHNMSADELNKQQQKVNEVIAASWLPEKWRKTCGDYSGSYLKSTENVWSVCLRHDKPSDILASISLLGWQVPQLPDEIRGEASIRIAR